MFFFVFRGMNRSEYKLKGKEGYLLVKDILRGQKGYNRMMIRDAMAKFYFEKGKFSKQRRQYLKALEAFPNSISVRYKLAIALEPFTNRVELLCTLLETGILIGKQNRLRLNGAEKEYEMEYYKKSLQKLALLYCQQNRNEEARYVLGVLQCTHRLSKHVLFYQPDTPIVDGAPYVKCFDNLLNDKSLLKMQQCFKSNSSFWTVHGYNEYESRGYFSFTFDLDTPPRNFVDQYILELYKVIQMEFPDKASNIRIAEWWAHCRPHSMGHQMHYDSENEGNGEIRHPILSSVLYLSECGGPTLVTNQVMGGPLADKGFMIFPQVNRVGIFDAKFLHGVVPGRGRKMVRDRRCTFMVGFWDSITIFDEDGVGAARPSPGHAAWCPEPIEMELGQYEERGVRSIPAVWELIDRTPIKDYRLPMYEQCFQGF
jgi:hypothetical protein